jgi:hypothetical protein
MMIPIILTISLKLYFFWNAPKKVKSAYFEMTNPKQLDLPFSLLDLQGRQVLTVREIAGMLHCTPRHVCELISSEELCAINIGRGQSRMSARVPVESFRAFVLRSLTCDFADSPLRHLPTQSLINWHRQLTQHLKQKGIKL